MEVVVVITAVRGFTVHRVAIRRDVPIMGISIDWGCDVMHVMTPEIFEEMFPDKELLSGQTLRWSE